MKKRIFIISLALALLLLVGSSCDIAEQYKEQGQNQLQTYEKPTTSSTTSTTTTTQNQDDPSAEDPTPDDPTPDDPQDPDNSGNEQVPPNNDLPKAPDFTVYDANGLAIKLSQFFGKPIVLNFWASWCGPCQSEMPDFNQKYLEIGGEVQFLMINLTGGRETVSSAQSFINSKGYSFPVFFDTSYSASEAYSVYSIPATYFINAEGYIVAYATGAIGASTLQQGIDLIK